MSRHPPMKRYAHFARRPLKGTCFSLFAMRNIQYRESYLSTPALFKPFDLDLLSFGKALSSRQLD